MRPLINNSKIRAWLISTFLFISACSFGAGNLDVKQAPDLKARNIKRIVVYAGDSGRKEVNQSRLIDKKYSTENPEAILSEHIYTAVSSLGHWQIVSKQQVPVVSEKNRLSGGDNGRAKQLGEQVNADGVLFGRVLYFRERVGGAAGVESPASVAFVLYLLDVKRGDIIWSANYQETQKPLSDNIFAIRDFTRRGARWLTAEELSLDGVKKSVHHLHQILYPST